MKTCQSVKYRKVMPAQAPNTAADGILCIDACDSLVDVDFDEMTLLSIRVILTNFCRVFSEYMQAVCRCMIW